MAEDDAVVEQVHLPGQDGQPAHANRFSGAGEGFGEDVEQGDEHGQSYEEQEDDQNQLTD